MLSAELTFAIVTARRAGEAIMATRNRLDIQFKGGHELVTQADVEADQIIRSAIQQKFPGHDILSEELAPDQVTGSAHLWIVDPIDGTVNYAHQHPNVAISIAYYHQGQAVAAVVHNPFLQETFYASAGGGAFHQRWMPSEIAKQDWIRRVRLLDIEMMCPQHGRIFRGEEIGRFLDWFEQLPVGQLDK